MVQLYRFYRKYIVFAVGEYGMHREDRAGKTLFTQNEAFRICAQLALDLTAAASLDEAARVCLKAALRISEMDSGGLYLVDPETGACTLKAHYGLTEEFVQIVFRLEPDSPQARLVLRGESIFDNDKNNVKRQDAPREREGIRAIGVVPITHQGKTIACLNVSSHMQDSIGESARRDLEMLAAQIGNFFARIYAEEELKKSQVLLKQIADTIEDVFWVTDFTTKRTIFASQAYEKIWGRTLSSLYIDEQDWVVAIHEDDRDRVLSGFNRLETEDVYDEVYRIRRPDGEERWIRDRGYSVRDPDNRIVRAIGIAEDITERKKTECEKAMLAEKLKQAHKMEMIGTLAGGVAHDMNNVLTGITTLASLLKANTARGDSRWDDIEGILKMADRGQSFTRNLLGFARKGKYREEHLLLNSLVTRVEQLLERTISKKIAIETDLSQDLQTIKGDPGQLRQVVMNLCFNAIDAMDGKGTLGICTSNLMLCAGTRVDLREGRYVRLVVSDNGRGMTAEEKERAFEPFYTTKKAGEGTGLGLSMVYGTVIEHGGAVDIESEQGRGTRVAVLIPAVGPEGSKDERRLGRIPRGEVGTVLLVDDEDLIRNSGKRMLAMLGYEVLLAENGAHALKVFEEHMQEIDLVILDMAMPIMDGTECFRNLKKMNPGVRVLIASGFASGGDIHELLEQGAVGLLRKPFDMEKLSTALLVVTGSTPSEPPPPPEQM